MKWTYNRGRLPSEATTSGGLSQVLTIHRVTPHVVGVYECVMEDGGKMYSSMGLLHLKSELYIFFEERNILANSLIASL